MKDAAMAMTLLLEGMSIRAAARITGLRPNTICDLVLTIGERCENLLASIKGVEAKDIQADEIWSFVAMKERTRYDQLKTGDEGSWWTWIAVDRDSKLVVAHHVGQRDGAACDLFLGKIDRATTGRFQLSADGLSTYTLGVPFRFRERVDFGQVIKNFQGGRSTGRYSPGKIIATEKRSVYGTPDFDRVSTSHVERLNLTLRMSLRRFTRLTNGYSKTLQHHRAMQAIFFAFYNFCRKHETIRKTPAVAAGIADHQWTVRELIEQADK
ncbi:IS1 family transposase [Lacipirellula sp.]|uniref:IS1 family transposase n=1 Tax=Lacipirellula sp. TaxID=2691419 RepID=UPI003D09D581